MSLKRYQSIVTFVEEFAADAGWEDQIYVKPMFGGLCFYLDGRAFATITGSEPVEVALRLSQNDMAEVSTLQSSNVTLYGPAGKEFVLLPDAFVRDDHHFTEWLEKSLRYTRTLPLKTKGDRSNASGKKSTRADRLREASYEN
jgi:hypothetical protein